MNDLSQYGLLTTLLQALGVGCIACLLIPLARILPGRFLHYWAIGWGCLTIALIAVLGALTRSSDLTIRILCLFLYVFCEYLFAFLLWAGCREAVTGQGLAARDGLLIIPLVIFSLVGSVMMPDIAYLFPFHAVVLTTLFAFSIHTMRSYPLGPRTPTFGLWVIRGALISLVVLFVHHAVVGFYLLYRNFEVTLDYYTFSSLYDLLLETGLAFGMIMLASDRIRDELQRKNDLLASAATELAKAARTDSLTGLLNRRALDEYSGSMEGEPSGSLAVLDLNNLKLLNDQNGHMVGDVALQLVARALRVHFRVTDPLYRTGGDEFVVLMPGGTVNELIVRMQRIDESLQKQRLPGISEPVDLRLAWGVSLYDGATIHEALQKADHAMYERKRAMKAQPAGSGL